MTTNALKRIQLGFWNFVIHILTESSFIQNVITFCSRLITNRQVQTAVLVSLFVALAGFASGLLIYLLTTAIK